MGEAFRRAYGQETHLPILKHGRDFIRLGPISGQAPFDEDILKRHAW